MILMSSFVNQCMLDYIAIKTCTFNSFHSVSRVVMKLRVIHSNNVPRELLTVASL